jgi:hypothetical protein
MVEGNETPKIVDEPYTGQSRHIGCWVLAVLLVIMTLLLSLIMPYVLLCLRLRSVADAGGKLCAVDTESGLLSRAQ